MTVRMGVRIVVAVFCRRHATSRRRVRVYALQNTRAMYPMRAPSRSTRARSFVSLRLERATRDETGGSPNAGRIKSQNRPVTTREVNIENTTGFRIRVLKQGDDGRIWFKTRVTTRASERVEDDDARTGTVRAV